MSNYQKLYKIVVVGEGGVGKTTLIKRYVTGQFTNSKTTIGVSFAIANVNFNNVTVKMQIWDLGGEERFRTLLPSFCKGAQGAIIVFDQSRFSTFLSLPEWIELVKKNTNNIPIILVGSKSDLVSENSYLDQIMEMVKRYDLKEFIPVSSKTGFNIDKVFVDIAASLMPQRY
ncbi:MAG: GTP-binding protein [Candidatus Odinarchaeum yellowstonii]|uniref:GTP-binding protein n=1 Tax=Odinarchaeota yellowstonii (strain LCB_4) TaxID=1841599 RepID=A0AAF0D1P1_ODILC|nr:MAG: GTP-binding protein [Candidatus Odinarchaeum yellowstonii]